MAGAGTRLFPANSKLTSTQVNTYLMDQTIMRFATTTARDAAFGGVGEPTLAEGMTCYIDADNTIYTYDGSNWVKMVSASQPNGLVLIASGSLSLTTSATNVTDVFSTEFKQYKLLLNIVARSTTNRVDMKYIVGTTPTSSGYIQAGIGSNYAVDQTLYYQRSNSDPQFFGILSPTPTTMSFDIYGPNLAQKTSHHGTLVNLNSGFPYMVGGVQDSTTQFTGFQLFTTTGTAIADYQVFGYRN